MKKLRILSGTSCLLLLFYSLFIEIACLLLCFFVGTTPAYVLFVFWSIVYSIMLVVFNRIITIVTYNPEKKIITRRGFLGGFYQELRIADIIRTEVRMIPKEQEYIFLIDTDKKDYFNSLSLDTPIRVPNTTKGRAFVANFYKEKTMTGDGSLS